MAWVWRVAVVAIANRAHDRAECAINILAIVDAALDAPHEARAVAIIAVGVPPLWRLDAALYALVARAAVQGLVAVLVVAGRPAAPCLAGALALEHTALEHWHPLTEGVDGGRPCWSMSWRCASTLQFLENSLRAPGCNAGGNGRSGADIDDVPGATSMAWRR